MQTFTMMLQASGFALAMLVIVTLIGFGVTAWGFVDGDLELLVVPIVGLAVTAVGIQLLTPVLPPWRRAGPSRSPSPPWTAWRCGGGIRPASTCS